MIEREQGALDIVWRVYIVFDMSGSSGVFIAGDRLNNLHIVEFTPAADFILLTHNKILSVLLFWMASHGLSSLLAPEPCFSIKS